MDASQVTLVAYEKYLYGKDHDMLKKSIPNGTFPAGSDAILISLEWPASIP
jgi:hypothetical protein